MKNLRQCFAGILLLVVFILLPESATAEPYSTIRNNGNSANRIDIVILGDGYISSELSNKYANDVETFVQGLFGQQPFLDYKSYFNVHRVDVTSVDSGADHPELNSYKNTALDATYLCGGIQRLICINSSKVNTVLSNTSLAANQKDIILVIVNDSEYGGSGGSISVASTHSDAIEIILHELGHSFGLLADEYDTNPPTCNNSVEPSEVNITKETQRSSIKWNLWISLSTPIPTTSTTPGISGLYLGAKYCTTGLYRPTYDSKMRSLNKPFEQINQEQLIKRIYTYVSLIDSYSPTQSSLTLSPGTHIFTVSRLVNEQYTTITRWYVNGQLADDGNDFYFYATPGNYSIEARVRDFTSWVKNDPQQLLVDSRFWTVTVQ